MTCQRETSAGVNVAVFNFARDQEKEKKKKAHREKNKCRSRVCLVSIVNPEFENKDQNNDKCGK